MRPSGAQHVLRGRLDGRDTEVTIAGVAAALRAFTVGDVDIVPRYGDEAIPSLGSGIVMVPWPNRIDGGRWNASGADQQLDISEPEKGNALHGLLRTTEYAVVERTDASVTLTAGIYAPNGYPFVIETFVTYALTSTGLSVRHLLRNHSPVPAPIALGVHPYFKIGGVPTEDLLLSSSATEVDIDDERKLPIRRERVSGATDLRDGRRVGDLNLDHCFTGLKITRGRSVTSLTAQDGRSVRVWADESFTHQVLLVTRDFLDETGHPTLAVAIEPQTASVNAFNTGDGLRFLEQGEEWSLGWGVEVSFGA